MTETTQRPLRVAMLIHSYLPVVGGAEKQLASLCPLLESHDVRPTVLCRRPRGLPHHEVINGTPVFRLPAAGPKPIASISYTIAALRRLRRLSPDVIHTHGVFSTGTTAMLAKEHLGIPVVAKLLRGTEQYGDLGRLRRKLGGQRRLLKLRRDVDCFIAISSQIEKELDDEGIPPAQRRLIPNGVDCVRFDSVPESRKMELRRTVGLPSGRLLTYTGRIAAEKNLDTLIDLWPRIRKEHADSWLVLIGQGPSTEAYQEQAGDGVFFAGPQDDVAPFLQASDGFVLPSFAEGLSNALLEAMAVGLPAIASDVGGNRDLVQPGLSGWLIDPASPESLERAVLELLADAAQAQTFGKSGQELVRSSYDLTTTARRLSALYREVLES